MHPYTQVCFSFEALIDSILFVRDQEWRDAGADHSADSLSISSWWTCERWSWINILAYLPLSTLQWLHGSLGVPDWWYNWWYNGKWMDGWMDKLQTVQMLHHYWDITCFGSRLFNDDFCFFVFFIFPSICPNQSHPGGQFGLMFTAPSGADPCLRLR